MSGLALLVIGMLAGAALGTVVASRRRETESPDTPPWVIPESIEAIGFSLCEEAHRRTRRPVAVVSRNPVTGIAQVIAVSTGVDRRLVRTTVAPTSAAGRACNGDEVVVGTGQTDVLGEWKENRRLREQRAPLLVSARGRKARVRW